MYQFGQVGRTAHLWTGPDDKHPCTPLAVIYEAAPVCQSHFYPVCQGAAQKGGAPLANDQASAYSIQRLPSATIMGRVVDKVRKYSSDPNVPKKQDQNG